MAETHANLFRTTVGAGGITNAALSLPVAAAAPARFRGFEARCLVGTSAQLGDGSAEIMLATIPADGLGPWTVARAVEPEGRPAVAHAVGEEVALGALTAGALAAFAIVDRYSPWLPTGVIAETLPRTFSQTGCAINGPASGVGYYGGIILPAHRTVNSITFITHSAAAGTPLNQWFMLVDLAGTILAKTVDDTTAPWATYTSKTLALAVPFTPLVNTPVYVGVAVNATTKPNLYGVIPGQTVMNNLPLFSAYDAGPQVTTPEAFTTVAFAGGNQWLAYARVS